MNRAIALIVIIFVVVGGAYYLINKDTSGEIKVQIPTAETNTVPISDPSAAENASVSIQNFSFNPSVLSIKTGTTVTWTNNDSVPHTVTTDSGDLLNSSTIAPGQLFSYTFAVPGSVSYHCALHPSMKGTISVEN